MQVLNIDRYHLLTHSEDAVDLVVGDARLLEGVVVLQQYLLVHMHFLDQFLITLSNYWTETRTASTQLLSTLLQRRLSLGTTPPFCKCLLQSGPDL